MAVVVGELSRLFASARIAVVVESAETTTGAMPRLHYTVEEVE